MKGGYGMGGSAYLLFGSLDESLLTPRPLKQNIVDKLFGRRRYSMPRETKIEKKLL